MDFKHTQIGRLLAEIKQAMIAHTPIINVVTDQLEIISQLLWSSECYDSMVPCLRYDSSLGEYTHISPKDSDGDLQFQVCNYHIGRFPKIESIEAPVLIVNFTTDWKLLRESTTSFVKAYIGVNRKSNENFIRQSVYLVVTPSFSLIPADLVPYVSSVYLPKMDDEEIADILNGTFERNSIDRSMIEATLYNQMIVNFRGFSKAKIEQVLSKSIGIHYLGKNAVDCKSILNEIRIEKKSLLDGCRGLKWEKVEDTGVSGLDSITDWLEARIELFRDPERAVRQHMDIPRGIIVAGIPGSGKSLMAKSAAHILGLPLVSLDMGDLLGSLVGDSEHNMIEALRIAERMSPCVLWIDEIEKAFSGSSQNSSQSDGGVGRRMFGKFLTWMQEKSSSCFVFATSNDVTSLPPELFRSERFDRKFFTFMPTAEECAKIFASNIQKQNIEYKNEIGHLNFMQTLETPEYLFSPELENYRFWLQFVNDSCSSMMSSSSLEERQGKDGMSWYGWKDGKRPKLKLMTGADISALVKLAKFECYLHMKDQKTEAMSSVYDTTSLMQAFRRLIQSDEFKPYGETNLKDISRCFLKLYENQFSSASGNCIVDFEAYDPEKGVYGHSAGRTLEHAYDRALYYAVVGAINHYIKPEE